jgi:acyl-CoA synthetase (AMP-forming)/AMP-acid ligase II
VTTPERLLAWLDNPAATRGISFAQAGQAWDFWSYARLADAACRVAENLIEDGIRDDDVAVIILPTHPEFVATFFGALLAGAIPCPVAPVTAVQSDDAYARYLMGILAAARAAYVVTSDASMASIASVPAGAARIVTATQLLDASGAPRVRRRPPSLALLQFTSGSTAESRGVRIPFGALEANVQAIRQWLEWREDDAFASWLPLHHDMGLIGALIASIISRSNLWLMQPEQFVRSPARYLRCFGESGATLSVTASFALDHIVRRVNPASLSRCDFSRWRSVVVGAERIDPVSLERLVALLSPFGFRQRTLRPAYGLAEATLAVTGVPAGREWTTVRVQPESLLRAAGLPSPTRVE